MSENNGFDPNMINNIKSMMEKGELNDIMSKIPPEMIQTFSSLAQNNNSSNGNGNSNNQNDNANNSNNFDFSNIDMGTILKMKSVMDKMNKGNDPTSNLLHSLKPYLRDEKKGKIDQYANLLNISKMAELFNMNNNKENM